MNVQPEATFFDRTLATLRRAWRGKGDVATVAPDLPADDLERIRNQIDACLAGRGGEVMARAMAAELGQAYLILSSEGRGRFLRLLAADYGVETAVLDAAVASWQAATDSDSRRAAQRRLRRALVSRRTRLLTQFNALPQGIKFLVDMRAELLPLARVDAELRPLEEDLRELLTSWFDIGFLALQRIDWDSPASLLEKLIDYEAVHEIRSWDDLKNRLDSDRRCYAFFHPHMPEEPLIFVEVALVNGMADNVQHLLDEAAPRIDPDQADTAIFYSISNAQAGLAGVGFGDFLIKRVVDDLSHDFPRLKTFATLSPIPDFRAWLDKELNRGGEALLEGDEAQQLTGLTGKDSAVEAIRMLLDRKTWHRDPAAASALKPVLLRLCASFLAVPGQRGRARDRVAHFHLTNGARLERINWLANTSPAGLQQSAGLMVNYLYKLNDIERNNETYTGEGRIATSTAIRRQMRLS